MIRIIQSCDHCKKSADSPDTEPPEGWYAIPNTLASYDHRDKRQHVSLSGEDEPKIACSLECAKLLLNGMVEGLKPFEAK